MATWSLRYKSPVAQTGIDMIIENLYIHPDLYLHPYHPDATVAHTSGFLVPTLNLPYINLKALKSAIHNIDSSSFEPCSKLRTDSLLALQKRNLYIIPICSYSKPDLH